jgi:hypothetical protein
MKRFLLTLGALALAASTWAQTVGNAVRIPLMSDDDSDSVGAFRYCALLGSGDDANAQGRMVNIRTTTATSGSTTVTAVTTGTGPFQNVAVGDELTWPTPGTTPAGTATPAGGETVRYVVAKASADSITVGPAAIDLSIPATGYPFTHRKLSCGTTAAFGWFSTINFQDFDVTVSVDQGDATSVDAILQCENVGAVSMANNIWVKNYLLATFGNAETGRTTVAVFNHFDRCRVGISLASDASDAGANAEKISAVVRGRRPNP